MNPADRRPRVNVAAVVPETGSSRASANVIVVWDPDTLLPDIEEAIKSAARKAVVRVRAEVAAARFRPAPVAGQLTLPGT